MPATIDIFLLLSDIYKIGYIDEKFYFLEKGKPYFYRRD